MNDIKAENCETVNEHYPLCVRPILYASQAQTDQHVTNSQLHFTHACIHISSYFCYSFPSETTNMNACMKCTNI